MRPPARPAAILLAALALAILPACRADVPTPEADLVLRGGRVYTLDWDEPASDGSPAADAPRAEGRWQPDATAVAIDDGTILWVGGDDEIAAFRGPATRVEELAGAVVLPGLTDAHTHVENLGATLEEVDLVGVASEEEAVARVEERAAATTAGEWIVAYGWDDGAWADDFPDRRLLDERVPDHPVLMRGLHGFAVWGNQAALDAAGIDAGTAVPEGGTVELDARGRPTGLLLDRATQLLTDAVPRPTDADLRQRMLLGLEAVARAGYTAVHEAGVDAPALQALEALAADGVLPVRVVAMLSARDEELVRRWIAWGPDRDGNDRLTTATVKAFYDGALGSRGAWLLTPYFDMPGHRGRGGADYGFPRQLLTEAAAAGFQLAIHAIGDAANRETLDFFEELYAAHPDARRLRNRVEHVQVLHPDEFSRFAPLDLTASVQPGHAVEDMAWAILRLGPIRVYGAYAWRTLRRFDVPLVLSSDLPGSDHDVFYGLHAAITRRNRDLEPPGGWHPAERLTPEEAVRGYTAWAARAASLEDSSGRIVPGLWADLTVMDVDPLNARTDDPARLLSGNIVMTLVGGEVVYRR